MQLSVCVQYCFPLCSDGYESPGNPSQRDISQPVSRFSPVVLRPWWFSIHNATPGSPLPACNPSILSSQSALLQQEHISTVTEGVSQHLAPGEKKEGAVETKGWGWGCENNLDGDCRSTPCPAFSLDADQWAGSQLSVLACCRAAAAPPQTFSPLPRLVHTNPVPSLHFPLPFSSHQPSTAVRGYRSSKPVVSPSLGSSWTSGSSGGQGARGLQHYLSHHQEHLHHHPQSTHTSYAYCPAHPAVSTPSFSASLWACMWLSEYFSLILLLVSNLSHSPMSILGCCSRAHSRFSFSSQHSISLPFNLFLFPTLELSLFGSLSAISSSLLPLLYLFLFPPPLPFSLLQLNLFLFHSFSALAVQWETNWSGDTFGWRPLLLSLELIAVLQSVWFDFIGAIWFSHETFGVWLELGKEPN